MKDTFFNAKIRPIILSAAFPSMGFVFIMILKMTLPFELSKPIKSIIAFVVSSSLILVLFPRVLGIPFGKTKVKEFLNKSGAYMPKNLFKYVLLGLIAAIISLSGMYVGSLMTGKFQWNFSTITLGQFLFSLTPGIWEEIMYRGVIMILLLSFTKSMKKAFVIQILIFGFMHLKALDFWSLFDIISVMVIAIAFTYMAIKTNCLISGIIFHYLHDSLLFFVQLPGGEYSGLHDNMMFYIGLWTSILIILGITKLLAEKWHIRGEQEIFSV